MSKGSDIKAINDNIEAKNKQMNALILESVHKFMYHYHPNPYGSDYRCEYCKEEPRSSHDNIHHLDNCLGVKLQIWFRDIVGRV